jgi:hypothetical protein
MGQPARRAVGHPLMAGGHRGKRNIRVPRGRERIPPVAASERGGAQTAVAAQPAGDARAGLDEARGGGGSSLAAGAAGAEGRWNGPSERVRTP